MINLDRIECYAHAATPGPWKQAGIDSNNSHWMREVRDRKDNGVCWCGAFPESAAHANAAYLAVCDPQTMLALCRIARAAQALADEGQEYEFDDIGLGRAVPNSYWEDLDDALDDALKASP